ncbi:MAG: heavy-metal-associated domain-containing protein, partial [Actinomycetota bacterium]|nr:heavy-metal-associated domain-containing protein [Actinomycetota bacterium]
AHVHQGTCADLDPNPYLPLADVAPVTGEPMGAPTGISVAVSVTLLDIPLDAFRAEEYAIDVHEGADAIDRQVACGAVGGVMIGNDLVIGLRELNGSGAAGVARLRADGERTEVTVYLGQGLFGATRGTTADQAQAAEANVTFRVPTITCASCALRVEASIRKAPGILEVDFDGQDVTVTYDPSRVSREEIEAAIEAGGDTVELAEA